jgi:hypothetical protein
MTIDTFIIDSRTFDGSLNLEARAMAEIESTFSGINICILKIIANNNN